MSLAFDLGRIKRLARKELNECLRDRRTILTLVLMPLLLYPLLTIALRQLVLGSNAEKGRPSYRIAFASEPDAKAFLDAFERGRRSLLARTVAAEEKGARPREPEPPPHLAPLPELKWQVVDDVSERLRSGEFDVGVVPRHGRKGGPGPLPLDYELVYQEGSAMGRDCVRYLEAVVGERNADALSEQFELLRRAPRWPGPVAVRVAAQPDEKRKKEKGPVVYRVGFISKAEAKSVLEYAWQGHLALTRRSAPVVGPGGMPLPPEYSRLRRFDQVILGDAKSIADAVREGKVDVGVRLRPAGGFTVAPGRPLQVECDLLFREGDPQGLACVRYLEHLIGEVNALLFAGQLNVLRRPQGPPPLRIRVTTLPEMGPRKSTLLPVLVPLVLVLMTMTGAVYPAIDLTAGERERGTLEVLVAAPIPRLSVLFAKYLAVFAVAVLTALVNLGTMAATLQVTGLGHDLFGSELSFLVLVQVLGLLLLFAAFFSAVLLAVTSFARSFKEAQAYLIPLVLVSLMPGMLALMPGLDLRGPLAVVPLLNVVLLARDVFEGTASFVVAGVVVTTTLLYALAAIGLAARIFGTEAVLSEQSSWSDLFRRPERPQDQASPSSALLCLALMFPAFFMLLHGLARIDVSPGGRLALMAGANLLLFGAIPLASGWLGWVRPRSALLLRAPPLLAWLAAVLLGLCLWPFVYELDLLLRAAGINSLRPEHLARVKEVMEKWRGLSPILVVAALALVPALLEELFFRGYLFSALKARAQGPWPVVLTTAALFALFHLLVGGSLAVERLPPSFLLGLVLGGLCWRTGSVWPCVLMHAVHNGTVVLLGYYEPELLTWLPAEGDHLPALVLLGAGVGAGLAALALWAARAKPPLEP